MNRMASSKSPTPATGLFRGHRADTVLCKLAFQIRLMVFARDSFIRALPFYEKRSLHIYKRSVDCGDTRYRIVPVLLIIWALGIVNHGIMILDSRKG
jgi:hypothetical protein